MTTADLQRAHDVYAGVLANVTPEHHALATPCASWDVAALIDHVRTAQRTRVGRLGAGPALHEVAAFEATAPDAMVELPFGTIPAAVFLDIATGDVIVHAWDLATATGQSTDLAADLCEALQGRVAGFLTDALRGPDGQAPFGPEQTAPPGSSAADRFAAFMGRVV